MTSVEFQSVFSFFNNKRKHLAYKEEQAESCIRKLSEWKESTYLEIWLLNKFDYRKDGFFRSLKDRLTALKPEMFLLQLNCKHLAPAHYVMLEEIVISQLPNTTMLLLSMNFPNQLAIESFNRWVYSYGLVYSNFGNIHSFVFPDDFYTSLLRARRLVCMKFGNINKDSVRKKILSFLTTKITSVQLLRFECFSEKSVEMKAATERSILNETLFQGIEWRKSHQGEWKQYGRDPDIIRKRRVFRIKKALENGDKVKYNRCKVMFVGDGLAGKTSTIRSLLNQSFQKTVSTRMGEADKEVTFETSVVTDWKVKQFSDVEQENHVLGGELKELVEAELQNQADSSPEPKNPEPPQLVFKVKEISQLVTDGKVTAVDAGQSSKPIILRNRAKKTIVPTFRSIIPTRSNNGAELGSRNARKADHATLTFWDFAGQGVYYSVHHLFLSSNGIYVLVFNTEQMISSSESALEALSFWLLSLSLHAATAPVLMVGTHALEVTKEELRLIHDKVTAMIEEFEELQFVANAEEELYFFPIDNSLGRKNEGKVAPIRKAIQQILTNNHKTVRSAAVTGQVSLAWAYLMDILTKEYRTHVGYEEVLEIGQRFNFSQAMINEMLKFYHEKGTILFFPERSSAGSSRTITSEHYDTANFVILKPEWLLRSLACFIYDISIHGTKKLSVLSGLLKVLRLYEENGLAPTKLLDFFWNSYSVSEKQFLKSLCVRMNIMSNYVFSTTDVGNNDLSYILVPAMIQTRCEEVENRLPFPSKRATVVMKFNRALPKGVFERVICGFVERSGEIEGSKRPDLFSNFASVWYRNEEVFLYMEEDQKQLKICTTKASNLLSEVIQTSQEMLLVISETFKQKITGMVFCYVGSDGPETSAADVLSLEEKNSGTEMKLVKEFDCFLAHEWGEEEDDFTTHQRVLVVKQLLSKKGFTVWVDEENLRGDLSDGIIKGVKKSKKILVFITTRYMKRLENPNNNCTKELAFALREKGLEKVIPVLFQSGLENPNVWKSKTKYHLGNNLYVDFNTEEKMNANLDKLCEQLSEEK